VGCADPAARNAIGWGRARYQPRRDAETVERRRGVDTAAHGGEESKPAAAAKADGRNLAVAEPLLAEPTGGGSHVGGHHVEVERLEPLPGLGMIGIVVGNCAGDFRTPE